jgi:predicted nucleotidyltransferase
MIKEQKTIIRLLNALYPGVKIYLFGSRARGTAKPFSDIDLAIDTGKKLTFIEIAIAKNVIDALNMPITVDVVDMHSIPESLKTTILKEGILWEQ